MSHDVNTIAMIKELWTHLSKRRKKQYFLLLILMFFSSISEVISVGAVLPFLAVLTSPETVFQYQLIQKLSHMLGLTEPSQLMLPLTIFFITAVILAGLIRLSLLYVMTRLSFATGADLSINIYRRTLYQEYAVHVSRNSSEVINGVISKTHTVIGGVITPTLDFISSILLLVGILTLLLVVDTVVALSAFTCFGLVYWGVIRYTKAQLTKNSQVIANQSTQMIKSLQEGLAGIRDVLIDGTQEFYCELYQNADLPLRRASGSNVFIGGSPKYIVEAIGITLISGLAYIMTRQDSGLGVAIPVLGVLAIGAQRLLPALQLAYGSYSAIKGAKSSFQDVLKLLKQPLPEYMKKSTLTPIVFERKIQLKNLSFCYSESSDFILKNINISIKKGGCIGIIGSTGSGKSTLIDIIMGLLNPTDGNVLIDGSPLNDENRRAWQMHIAHVPQNIYLADSSIEENIAFGVPKEKINHQRVRNAAKQAQISELIEKWNDGYQTYVGERGVRISGGQRQRIGIARALYKESKVLIFDEATSALDNHTEKMLMETIDHLKKEMTILIIAHRITTLKNCDYLMKLSKDNGINIVSYEDVDQ
jgi:ATP-binding cassette, subfamily B, bacterial PglK